jgi:hypothetical protein
MTVTLTKEAFESSATIDRLWSYHDSRADYTHEITRAHVDEAARVLKSTPENK